MGTLTDATDGMLQDGESSGTCRPKVVVQESSSPVIVSASNPNTVIATEAGGVTVSQSVNRAIAAAPAGGKQVIREVERVVVAGGCAPAAPATPDVSSYNDLTDVPASFNPAPHVHAISDVTGLEQRLFTSTNDFVFDIDAANADNGVTDPYKFVSALAAYAAIWELIPRLTIGAQNTITLLFGDGTYSLLDFHLAFVGLGANTGTSIGGCPIMLAQARIFVRAKNYPDVIPDGDWTAITSTATYNAQQAAANVANKALVAAAFNVVFYVSDADMAAYPWQACCLGIPANFILDGVAFVYEEAWAVSLNSPYFEHFGAYGPGGYAIVNAYGWWGTDTYSPLNSIPNTYAADALIYDPYYVFPYCRPVYHVNAACRMPIKFSQAYIGIPNAMKLVLVNPMSALVLMESFSYYITFGMQLVCIGALGYTHSGCVGWLHIMTNQFIDLFHMPGSVCPSGQTLISFRSTTGALCEKSTAFLPSGSAVFPGVKIENKSHFPQKMQLSYAVVSGKFTGGIEGRFSYNHGITLQPRAATYSGTGSPEGAVYGYVGDQYQRTDGGVSTTLYVKQSGNNTNTGWAAK